MTRQEISDEVWSVMEPLMPPLSEPEARVGRKTVVANLEDLVAELIIFYRESFPIAASMLGSATLRAAHRESAGQQRVGPEAPAILVQRYIEGEIDGGRIADTVDAAVAARLLTGAALFEAFQAAYQEAPSISPGQTAKGIVAAAVDLREGDGLQPA